MAAQKHSEVVESACLHHNVPIMHNCMMNGRSSWLKIKIHAQFSCFFRCLKFLLKNYQSSCFMVAIIWPVLIENITIYLVSVTSPWPTYDCLLLCARQSVFISLLSVGFQKTWNGFSATFLEAWVYTKKRNVNSPRGSLFFSGTEKQISQCKIDNHSVVYMI